MRTFCLDSLCGQITYSPWEPQGRIWLWLATAARYRDLRKASIILTKPLTSSTSVYVSNSSYPSNLSPCPSFLFVWVIDLSPFIHTDMLWPGAETLYSSTLYTRTCVTVPCIKHGIHPRPGWYASLTRTYVIRTSL